MMSKLDELRRGAAGHAAESMGAGIARRSPLEGGAAVSIGGARYQDLAKAKNAFEVPVDRIVPDPNQPRKVFAPEDLQDLADSIRDRGLLQPIRVRWDEGREKYVVVAGERRWRAARMAGLDKLSCVVDGEMAEAEILLDQLVENCLRADLQPIEQAEAFRTLMDAKGWSGARLAEELHVRDSTVFKAIALLELPGEVRAKVAAGEIRPATAYEISQLNHPQDQVAIADRVVAEKLTRDQVADVVRARKQGRGAASPAPGRAEFRLDGGCKVTVAGLPDERPETVVAKLREALKAAQARARESARGDEKAA